jgi:hypothetical protein
MSFKRIVIAGLATTALAGAVNANDTYSCGDQVCTDDQAEETRRLNEAQLENPGAGAAAVAPPGYRDDQDDRDADDEDYDERDGGYDDRDGQGGPYEPADPEEDPDGRDASGGDDGYPPDESSTPSEESDEAPAAEYGDDDDAEDDDGAEPDADAPYPQD